MITYEVKVTTDSKLWHHMSYINAYSELDAYLIAIADMAFVEYFYEKYNFIPIIDWILKKHE